MKPAATNSTATLELLKQLIACRSITPVDANCQGIIGKRLQNCGFSLRSMPIEHVENLWAVHGTTGPLMVFAGHTDVVPPGNLQDWLSDPFTPTQRDGFLFGRGAADMKSGLAAMVVATERFLAKHPKPSGRIAFLITSDEEGPAQFGTKAVMQTLTAEGTQLDYCIVGEASSDKTVGDAIKHGRRGSLHGALTVLGQQGHVAHPDKAKNAIHLALKTLDILQATSWDMGNADFPPTTFQITNMEAGTGADNVIPGRLKCLFNLRFNTEWTVAALQKKLEAILKTNQLPYELTWHVSGLPFLTNQGRLLQSCLAAIQEITGLTARMGTDGGTSDGRFIAPTGTEVIELGPVSASIHQVNEHIAIQDLEPLTQIYEKILEKLLLT